LASVNRTKTIDVLLPSAVMELGVTEIVDRESDAGPATVSMFAVVPAQPLESVAVTVVVVPATVWVVSVMVAMPLESVIEVGFENLPSEPLRVHMTTRPAVGTA
jgi:hypothetical protein